MISEKKDSNTIDCEYLTSGPSDVEIRKNVENVHEYFVGDKHALCQCFVSSFNLRTGGDVSLILGGLHQFGIVGFKSFFIK